MPQFVLPQSFGPRVREMLSDSGAIVIQPMHKEPLTADGDRWRRFTCSAGNARAVACIGEHNDVPGKIVVTVSADLRRLPLIWRMLGDLRLVRRLARTLEREGAELLTNKG